MLSAGLDAICIGRANVHVLAALPSRRHGCRTIGTARRFLGVGAAPIRPEPRHATIGRGVGASISGEGGGIGAG